MKDIIIITILLGVYTPLFSQWNDDFSDGEFNSNPQWIGNDSNFIVDGQILRLNALAVSGSSYLTTNSEVSLEAEWNFFVRLDFNPSSSNYAKVFLMADSSNLANTTNGYFVKIGGTPDEVSLYKISDGTESLLIDGTDGRVSLSSVEIIVNITRNGDGNWNLNTKLNGETNFISEGSVNDLDLKKSSHFGLFCQYTSTRSTKFYLDDISVTGNPYVDADSPELVSVSTPESTKIKLAFNEAIDTVEVKNSTHFLLNQTLTPSRVTALSTDTLLLEFSNELKLINMLELTAIPDLVGNEFDTSIQVLYIDPAPYTYRDLVINEVFADHSPQEDLPVYEFIEVLNISDRIMDLEGWQLTDRSKVATLGHQLIYPDSLLIICSIEALPEYLLFGKAIGVSGFPTLNNNEDRLQLTDSYGTIIDSLTYSTNWYNNNLKDDGGWSLEQINPTSKCNGEINWTASISPAGGTPGKRNSVYSVNTDFESPLITQALVTNSLLELWFSELVAPNSYTATILPIDLNPVFKIIAPSRYTSITLNTSTNNEMEYSINIPLEDCKGNKGLDNSILIQIHSPAKGDIVINEVLFNPFSGGTDFVEIANTTLNYYNLKGFAITNEASSIISDTTLLLKPFHFMAFSEDILFLKNQYLAPDSSLFEADLPSLPNDEGMVILTSNLGKTIDSILYSDEYHFSIISDTEGISLERISTKEASTRKDNWRSAAETAGFSTPGYENSQSSISKTQGRITISPEIITPNNDGQNDYCQVLFELGQQSQTININVYTINGQLVKNIASNTLVPPSGFFTWDGTNQQGGVLATAHYIIVSELITSDGQTQVFRNKVVVANGF